MVILNNEVKIQHKNSGSSVATLFRFVDGKTMTHFPTQPTNSRPGDNYESVCETHKAI